MIQPNTQVEWEAFRELVARHEGKVAGVLHAVLGHTPEAEDLGQEVFVQLYDSLNKLGNEAAIIEFLVRTAVQVATEELRKRKKAGSRHGATHTQAELLGQEALLDLSQQLDDAFRQLEPELQALATLRLIEGYSTEETSALLGVSKDVVLARLASLQQQLREGLANKL